MRSGLAESGWWKNRMQKKKGDRRDREIELLTCLETSSSAHLSVIPKEFRQLDKTQSKA